MRRSGSILFLLMLMNFPLPAFAGRPTDQSGIELTRIERAVEGIRQLSALGAVRTQVLAGPAFTARYRAILNRDNPAAGLSAIRKELTLMGLLDPGDAISKYFVVDPGVADVAVFDPVSGTLYIRSDSSALTGPVRSVVAQQYVGALLDGHFHLDKLLYPRSSPAYRNSDIVTARDALVRGDEVQTQTLYIERTYSPADLRALLSMQAQSAGWRKPPKAVQRLFDFPYTAGLGFVHTLWQSGGMLAVDGAYKRPPVSTYEILHPGAYARHWRPVSVSLHVVRGLESWQVVDDDVFGALGYDVLLWQHMRKRDADAIVSAYRGDRYVVLEKGVQDIMLMKSAWTTAKSAAAARGGIVKSLVARYPAGTRAESGSISLVETPGQTVAISQRGAKLRLVYAPTTALALQTVKASTS